MELFEDMFEAADALETVDTEVGKNLSSLVRNLRAVEQQIFEAEQHLKTLKREKERLEIEAIPGLMSEMGVERVDVDGATVSVKMKVHASIPVARREEAFAWLRSEGLDDIIKNDVILTFGKGEDNIAGDVVGMLQDRGFDPETKTHIHSSTLRAFVKERVENGKPIDLDMFGAFVADTAEIKRKAK
jgi:hypothetical protein